jgi:hypothetical protein
MILDFGLSPILSMGEIFLKLFGWVNPKAGQSGELTK